MTPPEPAAPEEPLPRPARWAALGPKSGLLLAVLGLAVQWALPPEPDAPAWIALAALVALGLGGAVGLGLGVFILRRKPAPAARKRAFAGILWGGIGLTGLGLLGGCALILSTIRIRIGHGYETYFCHTLCDMEAAFHQAHPGRPVTLNALLSGDRGVAPGQFAYFSRADYQTNAEVLRKTPYILVPGFRQPPRPTAIAVFIDPHDPTFQDRGQWAVAYEDGHTAFLPAADLEKALRRQTGLTVAEIIHRQRNP